MRLSRLSVSLIMLVSGSLAACSTAIARSSVLDGLTLSLQVESDDVSVGDQLPVVYVLKNSSDKTVTACIAESDGFNLLGSARGTGRASPADHPGCVRRFELRPGADLEWSGTIQVADVGAGRAKLNAWIQVVDPAHCDKTYGCHSANVVSPFISLNVRANQPKTAE
jgi:hypothetical protein